MNSSEDSVPIGNPAVSPDLRFPDFVWVVSLAGVGAGVSSALFLILLDWVTRTQHGTPGLVWFLPLLGGLGVWIYRTWGRGTEKGIGLVLEGYRRNELAVPLRMAPLILLTTLLTHLGGGSAGREGTAVQMSVGLLSGILDRLGISRPSPRMAMESAIGAGFGAVFGTPLAGAVFALEMPIRGRFPWKGLLWTLPSAWLGHGVCLLCGGRHPDFGFASHSLEIEPSSFFRATVLGLAAGLVARMFVVAVQRIAAFWRLRSGNPFLAPLVAGLVVAAWSQVPGFSGYLGLGVGAADVLPSLGSSFQPGGIGSWGWLWKLLFTAVTVASGFRGGEVTPLFFVGAALGNALGTVMGWPVAPMAALGFAAVFAGASHTPMACVLLGCEVFGLGMLPGFGVACWISHRVVGREGLYPNRPE